MRQSPEVGGEVAGYRLESVIGRGGMGTVYLAHDERLDRKVALKFLSPELSQDPRFRERFVRESRLAASLDHPNIVPIFEAGEAERVLFIAMRYVEGTDLKTLLRDYGELEPDRALSILSQTASALDAAHGRGLVHRDVKPANILLAAPSRPEAPPHVYLSDFGLTKRATSDSGITATGQFIGTLDYAAPEQFEGRPLDARTDVYSLGCVLYECLTGEVPFARDQDAALMYAHLLAPPPRVTDKRPDLPDGLNEIIGKAMAKAPDDRHTSCGELVEAAQGVLGTTLLAPPAPPAPRRISLRPRWPLPRRGVMALVAVILVAGGILAFALTREGGGRPRPKAPPALAAGRLVRIDPATGTVSARVGIGRSADTVAVGDGAVWVADAAEDTVARIDPTTNRVVDSVHLNGSPSQIAVGEGGVWVATQDTLYRIDPITNELVGTPIDLPTVPTGMATGLGAVWVGVAQFDGLVRVDPSGNALPEVSREIGYVYGPDLGVAVTQGRVWIGHDGPTGGINPVNRSTLSVIAGVTLNYHLTDFAVDERAIWVVSSNGAGARIDPATTEVVDVFPVERGASNVVAANGAVWVGNATEGTVSRLNSKTLSIERTTRVGKGITSVAVGEGAVWVTIGSS